MCGEGLPLFTTRCVQPVTAWGTRQVLRVTSTLNERLNPGRALVSAHTAALPAIGAMSISVFLTALGVL